MFIAMTEVGRWNADVLGISDTMSVEIEVKTSKADLIREFANKKMKHWYYKNCKDHDEHVPNFYWVVVPEALVEEVSSVLLKESPTAGLLVYTATGFRPGDNIRVVRKAEKLHDSHPSPRVVRTAILRAGSELCRSKLTILKLKEQYEEVRKRSQDRREDPLPHTD